MVVCVSMYVHVLVYVCVYVSYMCSYVLVRVCVVVCVCMHNLWVLLLLFTQTHYSKPISSLAASLCFNPPNFPKQTCIACLWWCLQASPALCCRASCCRPRGGSTPPCWTTTSPSRMDAAPSGDPGCSRCAAILVQFAHSQDPFDVCARRTRMCV